MQSQTKFTILFLSILTLDIILNNFPGLFIFRYLSKTILIASLFLHFYFNCDHLALKEKQYTQRALMTLFVTDLLILGDHLTLFLILGWLSMLLAKVWYLLAFKQKISFKKLPVVIILLIGLIYASNLFFLIYPKLDSLLFPAILFFIMGFLLVIFAVLREGNVSSQSYYSVLIGTILFIICESLSSINRFYAEIPYKEVVIMLPYAMAQFFIVKGILFQKPTITTSE